MPKVISEQAKLSRERIGGRLRAARLAEGMSQADLAKKVNVTQATISNWESGRTAADSQASRQLEAVLGPFTAAATEDDFAEVGIGAFGAWLRKARADAKMSAVELATKAGVTPATVYNLESGRSANPQARTRQRLADALNATVPREVELEAEQEQQVVGLGALTDFDPHVEGDLPAVAGVYVFYDVSNRPIYVGKAANISARVGEHSDKFWFKRPIVDNAAYIAISDEKLRHQLEQVLIKFLKSNAVINKQSVDR